MFTKYRTILTCIFNLCTLFVFSQNYTEDLKHTDSLLNIYEKQKDTDKFIELSHKTSLKFYRKKNYPKAIYYVKEQLRLGKNVFDSITYKKRLYNLARFYYSNEQFEASINTHKIIIDSFGIDKTTYKSYCQIGRGYNRLHDYFQSVNYYEKGLSNPKMLSENSLYGHYVNYAYVLETIDSKKSLTKGLAMLKKAMKLASKLKKNQTSLKNVIASYYSNEQLFNLKEASKYYRQNLNIAFAQKDTVSLIKTYNNLGELFNIAQNDSAEYYLQKGLLLSKHKKTLQSKLYFNLAEFFSIKHRYSDAINSTHKALSTALPVTIDSNSNHVVSIKNAITSKDKALIWHILTDKARYYLDSFEAHNDAYQATLALENLQVADQLLNSIRLEGFEDDSKLIWQDYASITYSLGVKACYILNNHGQAFYFMEKNKALLLLENISENQIKKQESIPDHILKKQNVLLEKIIELENELNSSKKNKDSLATAYFDSKIEYENFIESLKNSYPLYHDYKTPVDIINLDNFQNELDKNTIVVEYILDNTDGYILAITKDQTHLYKLNRTRDFHSKTQEYLKKISKPFVFEDDVKQTNDLSSYLHETLMPFLNNPEYKEKDNLVIVPDNIIQNIPFEALKDTRGKYIVTKYQVAYAYSISFLLKNATVTRRPVNNFIGFAPQTFTYDNLGNLSHSAKEIHHANSLFDGDTYIDKSATKAMFFNSIQNQKIIHLSTHAKAHDSVAPWIAFKNEKLYLNELQTTKNQAELVVLSACETSLGNLKKGEGVFSLARGFFYSGANSVVSSLWNVNDKSTQEIISNFYLYLKQGKTKVTALRLAKLNYLKNHSHSELSPYYWSSLILIGDTSKIDHPTYYHFYFIIFVCLVLVLFLIKTKRLG